MPPRTLLVRALHPSSSSSCLSRPRRLPHNLLAPPFKRPSTTRTTTPANSVPNVYFPTPEQTQPPPPSFVPPPPPRKRLWRRPAFWYTAAVVFTLMGAQTGYLVQLALCPPEPPEPFTIEDEKLCAFLWQKINNLRPVDILQENRDEVRLRASQPIFSAPWDSSSPVYEGSEFYEIPNWTDVEAPTSATMRSVALAGSRGMSVRRIFTRAPRDPQTGEMAVEENDKLKGAISHVIVMYIGPGCAGWPGVAHGGAIATLMTDAMRLPASFSLPIPAERRLDTMIPDPVGLSIKYSRPAPSGQFVVLRVSVPFAEEASNQVTEFEDGANDRPLTRIQVTCRLEKLSGQLCAEGRTEWLFHLPQVIPPQDHDVPLLDQST
ncbi:hypothetical protein K402DRAFT_461515 [Aulographum hederae CBS 113979]|uniref:Thioesterase domain-containing protein n=1 Tax=Aulographum hederae CBS 113979 TaxID=1176131 RepID=A0A6G1H7R5_9PEZI|nr:hypothetical protein K402DRAFT_461515 [Aulographum hederae CBS 113979]